MKDTELYAQFLGIQPPWRVAGVRFDTRDRYVSVFVSPDAGWQWCCPHCGQAVPGYDKRRRRWRHPDTLQFNTTLKG